MKKNCLKLIEISNKNDMDEKIMAAELYRNIGNYLEKECDKKKGP